MCVWRMSKYRYLTRVDTWSRARQRKNIGHPLLKFNAACRRGWRCLHGNNVGNGAILVFCLHGEFVLDHQSRVRCLCVKHCGTYEARCAWIVEWCLKGGWKTSAAKRYGHESCERMQKKWYIGFHYFWLFGCVFFIYLIERCQESLKYSEGVWKKMSV